MIKWIAIGITSLTMIVGAIFFLEDRFFHKTEAVELKQRIEEKSVKTFEAFQRSLDQRHLENLKDKKVIIEKELQRSPDDTYLKMRQEELSREQKRIEEKI